MGRAALESWAALKDWALLRDWAALRAVRSAAVASLWWAVEIADQRIAAVKAVKRSTAAKRVWRVALPRSVRVMACPVPLGGWRLL
jgi:hypothetical protein